MTLKHTYLYLFLFAFIAWSCGEDDEDLPSYQDRTGTAIEDLRDKLTAPANGWKLNYHPTAESGTYFMILIFDEDGNVNIQSDVSAEDGTYYDQDITYRLDAGLGLEMIFETYGVFHYLFELQQATFGAEFEFEFLREDGENLLFESKSDLSGKTIITLEPATASDAGAFSRTLSANFEEFSGKSPRLFGGYPPAQQLYFSDKDLSIFWTIDLVSRNILIDVGGTGTSIEEIVSNDSWTNINHFSGYIFQNGKLILESPYSGTVAGVEVSIAEVVLTDFTMDGAPLCDSASATTPVYQGTVDGLGPLTVTKSLFNSSGNGMQAQAESFYGVNIPFIFDADFNSLAEEGSIADNLPNASGFIMTYGFESDTIPSYGIGFIMENEDESIDLFLRNYEMTTTIGNAIDIQFTDSVYHSSNLATPEEEQALIAITDEIFAGGTVYAYELTGLSFTVYQFYNPCNDYEFVLVQ